jgi:hypothetical protein
LGLVSVLQHFPGASQGLLIHGSHCERKK